MKQIIINEIIADYFEKQSPFKLALDQLLHNNFNEETEFCHHKVRTDYKKYVYRTFDPHLADDLWDNFYRLFHAFGSTYNLLTCMVRDEILMLDEDGITFEDQAGWGYMELRDMIDDSMSEVLFHITDDYINNYEHTMRPTPVEEEK